MPSPAVELTLAFLSGIALLLSLKLVRHGQGYDALPGCGGGSGCDAVLTTRWSRWGNIPVATLASTLFLLCLVCSLMTMTPSVPASARQTAWRILERLSLLGGGAALWFIALQLFVVRRWCVYCLTVHAASLGIASVVLGFTEAALSYSVIVPVLLGCAVLVIGQVVFPAKSFAVQQTNMGSASEASRATFPRELTVPCVRTPGEPPSPTSDRAISLAGGKVVLRSSEWPILGRPDAQFMLAYLFDYTCVSCRHVHGLLAEAVEQYDPRLAVLMVPVPQHPDCNQYLRTGSPAAVSGRACDYSRLAMRLWTTDPAKHAMFERWLFEAQELPHVDDAVRFARGLIEHDGWELNRPDGDIDNMIGRGVAAHHAAGTGKVPTILFPKATIVGEVPSMTEFSLILRKELGLTPTGPK